MTRHRSCEVLIIGGGPVGLVLACLLADHGVDVVVLERSNHPRQYSRAIGLHPPALAVLQALGLEEVVLAEGTRVHSGTAYRCGQRLGSLSFEQAWPDRPFVLTLPQNRTEAILSHRLHQLDPAALHPGWEVTKLAQLPGEITGRPRIEVTAYSTDDARVGLTDGVSTWRADVVVGADGPRSVVRQAAGITTWERALPDSYLMGDFIAHPTTNTSGDGQIAEIFLETTGVVESFPLPDRMRRWVVHTGADLAEESAEVLAGLIAERTGVEVDPSSSTMVSAFHVRRRIAQQMAVGRCIIIGDAAHEVSPIGGQGMTLGWLDAVELAPRLRKLVAEHNPAPLHQQVAFQAFERERLAAARATARQAELNMALGRPMPTAVAVLRDAAIKTVLATRLRHRLARAFTMRQPLGGTETQVHDF